MHLRVCNRLCLRLPASQDCTRAPAAEVQRHRCPGAILTSKEAHEQPVAPASTQPVQVLYPLNNSAYFTPVYFSVISLLCACPVYAIGARRVLCMRVTTPNCICTQQHEAHHVGKNWVHTPSCACRLKMVEATRRMQTPLIVLHKT